MEDMIKMIADSPKEQRNQMITDRINMIAGQPETMRIESMKGLVSAISKLDEEKKVSFISDRTKIIAQLSAEKKNAILISRAKIGSQIPENVNMDDMIYTIKSVKNWPEEKRNMFIEGLKKAFHEANVPMPDIDAMMNK